VAWQRKRAYALQIFGQTQHEIVAAVRDGMAKNEITKPEQIDDLAAGASATTREILKGELLERDNATAIKLRATPEYQHKVVGTVADMLGNMDPQNSDEAIQIDSLVRQLPPGTVRNHYAGELAAKLKGEPEDTSPLGLNLKMLDDARKGGWFGRIDAPKPQNTKMAVDRGFLTDKKRLAALGADGNQANDIIYGYHDAASKKALMETLKVANDKELTAKWNNGMRVKKFQETYGWFTHATTAKPDEYTAATARAIDQREGDIGFVEPELQTAYRSAQWQATEAHGRVRSELIKWHKGHPKATATEIRTEMLRLAAPGRNAAFMTSAFDAAADTAPMVLPPKGTVPAVPVIDPYADPSTLTPP
jgi:hypothetical protein